METTFRVVTLEEADKLLSEDSRNRPLRDIWVDQLAGMMAAGDWYPATGDTIKISTAGKLLDGQHRLFAMLLYGKPLKFNVATGIKPMAQEYMDNTVTRTGSDGLSMHGYVNANVLAAASRLLLFYEHGVLVSQGKRRGRRSQFEGTMKFPPRAIRRFVEKNEAIIDIVSRSCKKAPRTLTPTLQAATRWFLEGHASPNGPAGYLRESSDWFFDHLLLGHDLHLKSPIFALRRLLENERRRKGLSYSWHQKLALTFKAWNLIQRGKEINHLIFRPGEHFPWPIDPKNHKLRLAGDS